MAFTSHDEFALFCCQVGGRIERVRMLPRLERITPAVSKGKGANVSTLVDNRVSQHSPSGKRTEPSTSTAVLQKRVRQFVLFAMKTSGGDKPSRSNLRLRGRT